MSIVIDYPEDMIKGTFKIKIKHDVFNWLIGDSGWTSKEIADRLGYPEREISRWGIEGKDIEIPINKVEILAESIKRPIASFFLLHPPHGISRPKDFRKLPRERAEPYSKETHLAMRKARRLQKISADLMGALGYQTKANVNKYEITTNNSEKTAKDERLRSGITARDQLHWENESKALSNWKKWIESKNILVFQIKMPMKDARGFSFSDVEPYIIVLNKSDSVNGRIFSLFHEYAHILLGETVICNIESDSSHDIGIRRIEKWCNYFAGAFLLPEDRISGDPEINELLKHGKTTECIRKLSKSYKISEYGVLVRLRNLDYIGDLEYEIEKVRILKEIDENLKKKQERERERELRIPLEIKCQSEKGNRLISLVFEGSDKGIISESDVLDYLDIKDKNFERMHES
jgi:Zn-dependent peptidase ImmA (M78 family)